MRVFRLILCWRQRLKHAIPWVGNACFSRVFMRNPLCCMWYLLVFLLKILMQIGWVWGGIPFDYAQGTLLLAKSIRPVNGALSRKEQSDVMVLCPAWRFLDCPQICTQTVSSYFSPWLFTISFIWLKIKTNLVAKLCLGTHGLQLCLPRLLTAELFFHVFPSGAWQQVRTE